MASKRKSAALDILGSHFESLERKMLTVTGLDFPLYAPALNFEQSLALAHANKEEHAGKQARKYAGIIIGVVETEDGQKAFPVRIEDLLAKIPPSAVSEIIEQLFDGLEEAAEALEGKCAKKKSAS